MNSPSGGLSSDGLAVNWTDSAILQTETHPRHVMFWAFFGALLARSVAAGPPRARAVKAVVTAAKTP
jgi:hypothetical protein